MKKIISLFIFCGIALVSIAQNVGIGTPTPDVSALLELQSSNKGLLLPRVADTSSIASPAKGLVVFSTNANAIYYFDGTSWKNTANGSNDSLWYKYQDSMVITDKKYVRINPNRDFQTPVSGLSVNGNLLIQQNNIVSKTPPTIAQTQTMNNSASSQVVLGADSVGRLFDPGGQNVNYFNNMQGNVYMNPNVNQLGISFSFNALDFGLSVGDTLWIGYSSFPNCRTDNELMLTNTTVVPADFNITGTSTIYIVFRSNADGLVSKGFDLTFRKIFPDNQTVNIRPSAFGTSLLFDSKDGSFQAGNPYKKLGPRAACVGCIESSGQSSFAASFGIAKGNYSTGFNLGQALGNESFAIGANTISRADNSFAMGDICRANGYLSFAMGDRAEANSMRSFSLGAYTTTNGDFSAAFGLKTIAQSYLSFAIGRYNDTFPGTSKTTWVNTDPLFYVGNGTSETNTSNALVIYKNADVDINGYTRLGKLSEGAPVIKMKKLVIPAGPAVDGVQSYPMGSGITDAKVLGVQIFVTYAAPWKIPASYRDAAGYEFNYQVQSNNIVIINKAGNSANIGGKPFTVLITYEE